MLLVRFYLLMVVILVYNHLLFYTKGGDNMEKSKVYFTKKIDSETLVKIYEMLGINLDGKVGIKADMLRLCSQNTCKNTVKRTHLEVSCLFFAHQSAYTFLHLPSRLVGKCQCKDVPRPNRFIIWLFSTLQKPRNFIR